MNNYIIISILAIVDLLLWFLIYLEFTDIDPEDVEAIAIYKERGIYRNIFVFALIVVNFVGGLAFNF